jgi:3-hydroxybutyryl-CoA dehydrogenase
MDLVGVDVNLDVAESFWRQGEGEPRWRPHALQARMVREGRLGRKSGRGWYDYRDGPHRPDDPAPPQVEAEVDLVEDGEAIEGEGFRAVSLERGSLEALGAGAGTVGFVAVPDLAAATVVELVAGPETGADALAAAGRLFASLGKHVECVLRDTPGLVLGRIVCQLVNEAHFAAGEAVGTPDDIDIAIRLGFNHPRGPFEWARLIGPERVVAVLDALGTEVDEERYRVAPLLREAAEG